MREIKFRVWDKFREKMIYPKSIKYGGFASFKTLPKTIKEMDNMERKISENPFLSVEYEISTKLKDGTYYEMVGYDRIFHSKRFIALQYIGLKDKKGKEIYEGDVVSISNGTKQLVKWNGCGFYMFEITDSINNYGIRKDSYPHYLFHNNKKFYGFVVGNIFETPELFNKSKIKLYEQNNIKGRHSYIM